VNDVKSLEDEIKGMPRIEKPRVFKRPTHDDQVSWDRNNALTIHTAMQGPRQFPPHSTNLANASMNTKGGPFNDDAEEELSQENHFGDQNISKGLEGEHSVLEYIDERGSRSNSAKSRFSESAADRDDFSTFSLESNASQNKEGPEKLLDFTRKVQRTSSGEVIDQQHGASND